LAVDVWQFIIRGNMSTRVKKELERKSGLVPEAEQKITQHIKYSFEVKSIEEVKIGEDTYYDVSGYASEFNSEDTYGDTVLPGAYKDTIDKNPTGFPAFIMHKSREVPVGLWYELKEDAKGLFVRCRLPKSDTFVSGRLIPQLKTKSIDALSIGWFPVEVEWDGDIRKLVKVGLREISFINKGYQADSGALITEIKGKDGQDNNSTMYNAMVDVHRKGGSAEVKTDISDFYHEKGKIDPFSDEAVISIEELKSLSKCNCAYAIRELKLSANASSHLAGLLGITPVSDGDSNPDVKKDAEGNEIPKSKDDEIEQPSAEVKTKSAELLAKMQNLSQSLKNGES
jgi:HK97 family phage prohead protease